MPRSPDTSAAVNSLLTAPLRPTLIAMALPALGEQLLTFSVGLFDTWLAGNLPSTAGEVGLEQSAVGAASYVSWLSSLMFALVSTGTMAIVARATGNQDRAQADRLTAQSLLLTIPLGVAIFCLQYFMAPAYASALRVDGHSAAVMVEFLRIDAIGELLFGFCLVGAAALRGSGNMRVPLLILGAVNLLNMAGTYLLVCGLFGLPQLGFVGIAWGTVIARVFGGVCMLLVLGSGFAGLRVRRSDLVPSLGDALRLMRVGAPHAVDGVLLWIGQFAYLAIISRLGDASTGKAYMAAHMIGLEIEAFSYLPATAWGYAVASLIGQSLGAQLPERARAAGHEAIKQISVWAIVASLVYFLCAGPLYAVMTQEPLVREIGVPALRVLALYQIPLVVVIVYLHALRGAGDTRTPMVLNCVAIALVRLPVGYLCGITLEGGLIGAWMGMIADVVVRCLIFAYFFERGGWMKVRV